MPHYAAFYLGLHCLQKYLGVSSVQRIYELICDKYQNLLHWPNYFGLFSTEKLYFNENGNGLFFSFCNNPIQVIGVK